MLRLETIHRVASKKFKRQSNVSCERMKRNRNVTKLHAIGKKPFYGVAGI